MKIDLQRVYGSKATAGGKRILVDRVWPRGVTKDALRLDLWLREIAPSDELRKWFGHDPSLGGVSAALSSRAKTT